MKLRVAGFAFIVFAGAAGCQTSSRNDLGASTADAEADAGGRPDAGAPVDSGTWPDAQALDSGIEPDAQSEDAGIWPDASTSDGSSPFDSGIGPAPLSCSVRQAFPPTPLSGRIFSATSYSAATEPVFEVTSGTSVQFATVPANNYVGPLIVTLDGRLLVTLNDANGSIFDITGGSTFTSTRGNLVSNLFPTGISYVEGFTADNAGRLYVANSETQSRIAVFTTTVAGGHVSYLPRTYDNPSGLVVCGDLLVIAEGNTGRIRTWDIATKTSTSFAFGFHAGNGHISAQLVIDHRGHLLTNWSNAAHGQGIYDVTAGGDMSSATPLVPITTSPSGSRPVPTIDSNQLAVDTSDSIYMAGASSGNLYVSKKSADGTYMPFTVFATGLGDTEVVAVGP
jgi:hypothetical protein